MYKLRTEIKLFLRNHPDLFRYIQFVRGILVDRKRITRKISPGANNPDKTIFVIRPNSEDGIQGLMSLFIQTMRWLDYANEKGYTPFVDFKNYKTQYHDGKANAWDYYFTQPSDLKIDEVYSSKNVTLSGLTWKKNVNNNLFRDRIFEDVALCKKCHEIIWNNIQLSEETVRIAEQENAQIGVEDCIGLYLRGTDYVKLRPAGEYVQPDIEDVIQKVNEFTLKYGNKNIFLVTEDDAYYQEIKQVYGDRVKIVSYDQFVSNYDGKDYLSKSGVLCDDAKKRGMDYLVKILLLSKCKYLVSSITMGSIAAYSFNGGTYTDKHIFNLGYYK